MSIELEQALDFVARRSFARSMSELARLKVNAMADLVSASEPRLSLKATRTLGLIREMRQDEVVRFRRTIARLERQSRDREEAEQHRKRVRTGQVTQEEEAAYRARVFDRVSEDLTDQQAQIMRIQKKLDALRAWRNRSTVDHPFKDPGA